MVICWFHWETTIKSIWIYWKLKVLKVIGRIIKNCQFLFSIVVLVDFCKLSIDYLNNGPNERLYTTAAEKLAVSVEGIQNCVYGLVNLLMISCHHGVNHNWSYLEHLTLYHIILVKWSWFSWLNSHTRIQWWSRRYFE